MCWFVKEKVKKSSALLSRKTVVHIVLIGVTPGIPCHSQIPCKGTKTSRLRSIPLVLSFHTSTSIKSSCRTLISSSTSSLETQVGPSSVFDGSYQRTFVDTPLPYLASPQDSSFVSMSKFPSYWSTVELYCISLSGYR